MDDEFEDLFGQGAPAEETPQEIVAEPPVAEAAPASGTEPPAAEPTGEVIPAAPPAAPPEGFVPREVLIQTRRDGAKKLTDAEARAVNAEERLAAIEADRQALRDAPDMFEDPEGFRTYIADQLTKAREDAATTAERAVIADRVVRSEESWSQKLGAVEGDEATDWARMNIWITEQSPEFVAAMQKQIDPYGAAHREWKRSESVKALGDKTLDERIQEAIAAERVKWESEHGAPSAPPPPPAAQTPPSQAAPKAPPAPPPKSPPSTRKPASLAALTGASGSSSTVPDRGAEFDNMFGQG